MNSPEVQREIKRWIESCKSPAGLYTIDFFDAFEIACDPGWMKHLTCEGDLERIREVADAWRREHREPIRQEKRKKKKPRRRRTKKHSPMVASKRLDALNQRHLRACAGPLFEGKP